MVTNPTVSRENWFRFSNEAWKQQIIVVAARVQQLDRLSGLPPLLGLRKLLSILHDRNEPLVLPAAHT